ncbi:MAG TPA: hypothetical protein VM261_17910 [Kofleriaceae bacterium]|nr:hypothetical protein [Kofleriaceae bacterium]
MPTRPDLRDITTGVKDALADSDRDALLEMLTFLIKEYVVDGPPPMLVHQTENVADLGRLSFAQLISALQTRLDIPELSLFTVDGEQVSVRVGGAMHALTGGRVATLPSAAADLPRPAAGVRVVEANVAQPPRPAAPAQPAPGGSAAERPAAPPPSRGLSVSSRAPAPEGGQAPTPPAPAAPAQPSSDKPDAGGDDASARFSLLELD